MKVKGLFKKILLRVVVFGVVIAIPFGAGWAKDPAKTEVLNWRMTTFQSAGSGLESVDYFAKMVKEGTNGRVNIKVYPAGTLFPTPQAWDACKMGTVEVIHDTAGMRVGNLGPMAYLIHGLPGAWRSYWENRYFYYNYGFINVVRELFEKKEPKLYFLGPDTSPPWDLMTKVPITKVSDYKGLKLRTIGFESKIYEKFGAKTITVGVEEIYTSLVTGIIDGTRWGSPSLNVANGFHEVCKYYIGPTLQVAPMNYYAINKKSMAKLTDGEIKVIEMAVQMGSDYYMRATAAMDIGAWQKMQKAGVKYSVLEPGEEAKMMKIVMDGWDELIVKADPVWGARGIQMVKDCLKKIGRPIE